MTVTVKHAKTNAIPNWTQAQLDEQIALGNFAEGTTLAQIVLPSDWNNDHTLTGIGTMAEQNANNVAITSGTINGTTIGATTASTGKFTSVTTPSVTASSTDLTLSAISTGAVKFQTVNGEQLRIIDNGSAASRYLVVSGSTSSANPNLGSSAGPLVLYGGASQGVAFFSNGYAQQQFNISHTASAVNYVQVTGAATGQPPAITAQGSDSNVNMTLRSKGTGYIGFTSGGGSGILLGLPNGSANYFTAASANTGLAPSFASAGSDTNIDLTLTPKGTGLVRFGTYTAGAPTATGYISIKAADGTTYKVLVST